MEIEEQKRIIVGLKRACKELEEKNDALEDEAEQYEEALRTLIKEASIAIDLIGKVSK